MKNSLFRKDGDCICEKTYFKDIIYKWEKKQKKAPPETFYHNIKTGKQGNRIEDVLNSMDYVVVDLRESRNYTMAFISEVVEIDSVLYTHLEWGNLHTTRCKPGELRSLEDRASIVFNAKKEIFACKVWSKNTDEEITLTRVTKPRAELPIMPNTNIFTALYLTDLNFSKATKAVIGNKGYVEGNRMIELDKWWQVKKWLMYKEPQKTTSSRQKLIDELTSYQLPPISIIKKTDPDYPVFRAKINKIVHEGVPWSVVRTFEDNTEGARIYTCKNQTIAVKPTCQGFVSFSQWKRAAEHWYFSLPHYKKEDVEGTPLEYYVSLLEKVPSKKAGGMLWLLLAHPIFEEMAKHSPEGEQCFYALAEKMSIFIKVKEDWLFRYWGNVDIKKKKLHQKFGLSPKLFEEALKNYAQYISNYKAWDADKNLQSPRLIKEMMNMDDISSIDQNTLNKIFDIAKQHKENLYTIFGEPKGFFFICFKEICSQYNLKTAIASVPIFEQIQTHRCRTTFRDTFTMVNQLHLEDEIKPYKIRTLEELLSVHDNLAEIINAMKEQISAEKWESRRHFWEKWVYEDNDQFVVVAPQKPEDLAVEGVSLHHCVKSYIGRVTDGKTNILFIRKKSDPNTPFFTVEISNTGGIEQIHGSCNCNVSTNPDVVAFVEEWIKVKKVKPHNYNKVR